MLFSREARAAVQELNNSEAFERKIEVSFARDNSSDFNHHDGTGENMWVNYNSF